MTDLTTPREGGCRCGKVRFKVSAPPLLTMACHCTGCQKMSSSAFSLSAAIPTAAFEVIRGETVLGGAHGDAQHHFCGWCMTWMFTRMAGLDAFVNIRPTLLDAPGDFATPFAETYRCEALPWATTPAVHSYAKFPPMEAYEDLMAEYARRQAGAGER